MNYETVIIAAIAGVPATLVALATLIKTLQTGRKVDGRLSELLELTRKSSKAEGKVEGKVEEHSEQRARDKAHDRRKS